MVGLARGAREAGVAVVAGETAIMPDVVSYFDLTATVVGIVRKKKIITGERMRKGDVVLGLRSSGIHSNGLTPARKLLLTHETSEKVRRELLRPTRIYVKEIAKLLKAKIDVHGMAHITGGAYSKLKRIGKQANVGFHLDHLPKPQPIFKALKEKGNISEREMYRTFNMGTGFLVICPPNQVKKAKRILPEIEDVGRVTQHGP
jgi:phosphoribosylformylglycinamidine cyclo-ligase